MNGPVPWIAESRVILAKWWWYAQGRNWRQYGQPGVLLVHLCSAPVDTRKPDDHVFAEPEEGVIGSRVRNGSDAKMSPLRELAGDETPNERQRYDHLIGMHSGGWNVGVTRHAAFFVAGLCYVVRVECSASPS